MILMSGKELAAEIKENLKKEIAKDNIKLSLSVILIGNDPASEKFVEIKRRACEVAGIGFKLWRFDKNNSQTDILKLIDKLNADEEVTGIVVQLPLPGDFVPNEILQAIDPDKDVDGLTSTNLGKLLKGLDGLFPATPEGVMNLLKYYQIPSSGKKVTVVGQSNLVGKPLAQMLLNEDATVLIANSKTRDLKSLTLGSDIVISAAGCPNLITADMVSDGVVVIDIGTTLVDSKIVGDVDFENVSKKSSYITPNPGGVGPMTVAKLLSNVLKAYKLKKGEEIHG
jgi:methylenetetrahydrofolate dehydrogenase (NADP+) / methenyltetrahydrofolate cyclohydrolase